MTNKTLNIGDHVIITLAQPLAVGEVIELHEGNLTSGAGTALPNSVDVRVRIPLQGPVNVAGGIFKLAADETKPHIIRGTDA